MCGQAGKENLLKVKTIAQLRIDHARIVIVEASDGDRVIQQDAMIGDVDDIDRRPPARAEAVTSRDVEGGVEAGAVIEA